MDITERPVQWGYVVKTTSDDCINAINSYFHQVLSYGRNNKVILEAPLFDKDCVLANILAAHHLSSFNPRGAKTYYEAARSKLEQSTPYEKEVFEAVKFLVSEEDKDDDIALKKHSDLLKRFPKDLVSLKRAQILCFYMDQPKSFLDLVQKVLDENKGESYIDGMHAFPLLELGHMDKAVEACEKGLKINKEDAWAHHCYIHVFYHKCWFEEAVKFMEERAESWTSCSSFMQTHNWWHVALCYLDGGAPLSKVKEIYDEKIWKELEKDDAAPHEVYVNALGMLLLLDIRCALDGFDFRFKTLADRLTENLEKNQHKRWLLDILIVWALTKNGESSKVVDLLEKLKLRISKMEEKKKTMMEKVIKLAEAVYEYARGNYKQALELLGSDFNAIGYKIIGASDEQIDVFNEMFCKMLLETDQVSTAIKLIEERTQDRKGVPFMWRLLEKCYLKDDKADKALRAGVKAKTLESAYF